MQVHLARAAECAWLARRNGDRFLAGEELALGHECEGFEAAVLFAPSSSARKCQVSELGRRRVRVAAPRVKDGLRAGPTVSAVEKEPHKIGLDPSEKLKVRKSFKERRERYFVPFEANLAAF